MTESWLKVTERTHPDIDVNRSLEDAVALVVAEIERLQAALSACRALPHPRRSALVRWHVRRLDQRHDLLDQLHAMIVAAREPGERIH